MQRVTIADVAKLAGVSKQTVSRAINNKGDIGESTKERVLEIARNLGYRPSRFARGLRIGESVTLGLLLFDLSIPYYPDLASQILQSAGKQGWNVVIGDAQGEWRRELDVLQVLARQADVLIGQVGSSDTVLLREFPGLPMVLLDHDAGSSGFGSVCIDFISGMRQAVDHLIKIGRRHIGIIDGVKWDRPPSPRRIAAEQRLREHGLVTGDEWSAAASPHAVTSGEAALAELLTRQPIIDGVICFNDQLAIGAMRELKRAGRNVPADVAVVGFDGLRVGGLVEPALTSVRIDNRQLAELAVRDAIRLLTVPKAPQKESLVVTPKLIVRSSA
ncbi:LacI family DNA-binding transcriptional regulator [Mangrovactinospora gilvigrisea]|uniref:LacI family DNA-binding transcriptional regulator n=1 Tax=Mangrovactinospora gilvigrisea TaxID=1428644 RepID=UPI0008FC215D|nr:LacI family DNA-binding transcriptional regulator [Mangrovactinospora gilvigrisea]